jgi:hypothetical protein
MPSYQPTIGRNGGIFYVSPNHMLRSSCFGASRKKAPKMKLILAFLFVMVNTSACRNQMPIITTEQIETATPFALPPTWTPNQSSPAEPTLILTPALGSGTRQVLLFTDWPQDRFPTDAAKITAITLEKNILKIQVVHQGGCQEHIFELHAWTGFLESNPQQGELYLSHDSHGDTCTENVEKLLSFDLTPLDRSRAGRHANPLLLRIYEPAGGSFANDPFMPLIEWP